MIVILVSTGEAEVLLIARGGAGGIYHRLGVLVAGGGDVLLSGGMAAHTSIAHDAVFRASSLLLHHTLVPGVTRGGDRLCPGLATVIAGKGSDAVPLTGSRGCDAAPIPVVAQGLGITVYVAVAAAAAGVGGVTLLGAGGCRYLGLVIMPQSRKEFSLADQQAAVLAIGISGVAGLRAGGNFFVAELRMGVGKLHGQLLHIAGLLPIGLLVGHRNIRILGVSFLYREGQRSNRRSGLQSCRGNVTEGHRTCSC